MTGGLSSWVPVDCRRVIHRKVAMPASGTLGSSSAVALMASRCQRATQYDPVVSNAELWRRGPDGVNGRALGAPGVDRAEVIGPDSRHFPVGAT